MRKATRKIAALTHRVQDSGGEDIGSSVDDMSEEYITNANKFALVQGSLTKLKTRNSRKKTRFIKSNDDTTRLARGCAVRTMWLRPRATTVARVYSGTPDSSMESDSHIDTFCLGADILKIFNYNTPVNAQGYDPALGAQEYQTITRE